MYSPSIEINIWIFVDWDYFCDRHVWRRCVDRDKVREVYYDTDETRHLWSDRDRHRSGPDIELVETKTHQTITERKELRISGIRPPSEFQEKVRALGNPSGGGGSDGWNHPPVVTKRQADRIEAPGRPTRVFRRSDAKLDQRTFTKPTVNRAPPKEREYSPKVVKEHPKLKRKPDSKPRLELRKPAPQKGKDKSSAKIEKQKTKKSEQEKKKPYRRSSSTSKLSKVRISR
jgi:hypothetical protein